MRRSVGGQPTLLLSQPVRVGDGVTLEGPREVDDKVEDELTELLASTVEPLGLELVEVDRRAGSVRVVVDRPGGADLEALAEATRAVSVVLDDHDPFPGRRYTLEVSSPGVERPLRTPAQFARAVGEKVSVRTVAGGQGERRVTGRLTAVDEDGFVLQGEDLPDGERRLGYAEVERARTVFDWGTSSRPGGPGRAPRQAARAPRAAGRKKVATP